MKERINKWLNNEATPNELGDDVKQYIHYIINHYDRKDILNMKCITESDTCFGLEIICKGYKERTTIKKIKRYV